jgi:putative transposase
MLAQGESARLAEKLIAESCERQGIAPGQLTVHADRGAAMTSKPVALLLADLGVTKSHSRPHVSNDNPYSEAQFKTLKYRPGFPDRFGSLEHGRSFCGDFFPWYNTEHHHVGLGLFTPHDVHHGLAAAKREQRARVLAAAFAKNPERFPNGRPSPRPLPTEAWINPPKVRVEGEGIENTPTSESNPIAIEAVRSSLEADLEPTQPEIPNLNFEEQCMAVAQ